MRFKQGTFNAVWCAGVTFFEKMRRGRFSKHEQRYFLAMTFSVRAGYIVRTILRSVKY